MLDADIVPVLPRMEAPKNLHVAPPFLVGRSYLEKCIKEIDESHAIRRRECWERLPAIFSAAESWDEF